MYVLLLAAALSTTADAFVVDLNDDPVPIGRVDGRDAGMIELPTVVLANRDSLRILGRRGGALRGLGGWACVVSMADGTGTLNSSLEDCRNLYNLPPGGSVDFVRQVPPSEATIVRLAVAKADPGGGIIIGEAGTLFLGGELSTVVAAAAWVGGRWHPIDIDSVSRQVSLGREARAAVDLWLQGDAEDLVIRAELEGAPREREWRAAPVWMSQSEKALQAAVAVEDAKEWCLPQARPAEVQRTFLVCMDAEGGEVRTRRYDERGAQVDQDIRALPTGAYIEVAVRHPQDAAVNIQLSDDQGSSNGEELVAPLPDPGAIRRVTTRRLFAPRDAGAIEVSAVAGGAVVAAEGLEVVHRYLGAVRLGVAIVGPSEHTFGLGPENEAGTADIIKTSADIVDGEVTVQFAPFLDSGLLSGGGRDYLLPATYRIAPTIGLGLLAVNSGSVRMTLFQSFYLGAELEITPVFAVSAAATLRRVHRLADGYQEGDLLPAGSEVPTSGVVRPGLGISVGFTPDALRIRAPVR